MIARIAGAFMRAVLVALLVVTPALMLPAQAADRSQFVILMALLAALLTFIEYCARSPSIVEFRDASPFNRLRFLAMFAMIFLLTAMTRGETEPTLLTGALTSVGTLVGDAVDFPLSPVRLVFVLLPEDAGADLVAAVRSAAGMACLISLSALAVFAVFMRVLGWPGRGRAFNVWVNLPLFDPTAGGDALDQLQKDARFNIALGILLPFLIPVMVKLASYLLDPITLANPQTLIWTMTAWAFLPASTIMRGVALGRVAAMIEEKRRRAGAGRDGADLLPV